MEILVINTKTFFIIIFLTLISVASLNSFASYNATYMIINSSGTIIPASRYIETYKSEIREVAVIDYTSVYANRGHCNWTKIAETLAAYNMTGMASALVFNYKSYYPSEYIDNWVSDRDEIALAVQAAHQYGLTFRLEFCVLYKSPNEEWKVKRSGGSLEDWLDPTNPEAREYLLNITEEIVTNYAIDDLSLDYIRYDDEDMPYTNTAKQQLEAYINETITNWPGPFAPGGSRFGEFLQWRMIPINTLVKEIYDLAKSIRPNITVSACTRYWAGHPGWALASIGQDPTSWIKDGYLDRLIPMTYRDTIDEVLMSVEAYLDYAVAGSEGVVPLTPYLSHDGGVIPPGDFAELVNAVRNVGCDGFSIAAYGGPGDNPNNPDPLPDIRNYLALLNVTEPAWNLYNITIQYLNESSAKISWETTKPATSKVEYNVTDLFAATQEYIEPSPYPRIYCWDMNYYPGIIIQNTTLAMTHQIILTSLQPNTYYYFRIQSNVSSCLVTSKVYTFRL